jgi:hypothetical protein
LTPSNVAYFIIVLLKVEGLKRMVLFFNSSFNITFFAEVQHYLGSFALSK